MEYEPVSAAVDEIARKIVTAAYKAHAGLGPGLLEGIYETCFCYELEKNNLVYERQVKIPIVYDGVRLSGYLRLDVLVEREVICELKAVDNLNRLFLAQLLTQLKLTHKRLGFLVNFNVPLIKDGIKRVVL